MVLAIVPFMLGAFMGMGNTFIEVWWTGFLLIVCMILGTATLMGIAWGIGFLVKAIL
jgi:hypothetical protein